MLEKIRLEELRQHTATTLPRYTKGSPVAPLFEPRTSGILHHWVTSPAKKKKVQYKWKVKSLSFLYYEWVMSLETTLILLVRGNIDCYLFSSLHLFYFIYLYLLSPSLFSPPFLSLFFLLSITFVEVNPHTTNSAVISVHYFPLLWWFPHLLVVCVHVYVCT